MLAAGVTVIALALIAMPGAQASHSGYVMPSHNIYQSGPAVTNWYNNADTAYTLGLASFFGSGRIALNAGGIRTYSSDADPALLAEVFGSGSQDAIQAKAVTADGVDATTLGLNTSAVYAHHEGTNVGWGVVGETRVGTGVHGRTWSVDGAGVVADNMAGGTALRVDGKAHLNGSLGVGTANPASKVQIVGGYLQLPTRTTAPPATDCDQAWEAGRMVVRVAATAPNLYVCRGTAGWRGI